MWPGLGLSAPRGYLGRPFARTYGANDRRGCPQRGPSEHFRSVPRIGFPSAAKCSSVLNPKFVGSSQDAFEAKSLMRLAPFGPNYPATFGTRTLDSRPVLGPAFACGRNSACCLFVRLWWS
jgi:hypothetical protein